MALPHIILEDMTLPGMTLPGMTLTNMTSQTDKNSNESNHGKLKMENIKERRRKNLPIQSKGQGHFVRLGRMDIMSNTNSSNVNYSRSKHANVNYSGSKHVNYNSGSKHANVNYSSKPNLQVDDPRKTSMRRGSMSQFFRDDKKTKPTKPTYQLGPYRGEQMRYMKARKAVNYVLDHYGFGNWGKYDGAKFAGLICALSNAVIRRVKLLDLPRYRYVCHVTASQLRHQGTMVASRHMWQNDTDVCIHVTKECDGFVLIVTLYAIYFE